MSVPLCFFWRMLLRTQFPLHEYIQQCSLTQRCWLVKGQAHVVELALPLHTTEPSARSRLAEWQEITWPSCLDDAACGLPAEEF